MGSRVALIMPSLNEESSVDKTLSSVFASTRLPDEIIVSDGHSTDNTLSEIEKYKNRGVDIRIISNDLVFAGAGRNKAVGVTDCDVLLLLDFGNTVDPQWIEKMAEAFEQDDNLDFVSGAYKAIVESDFEHCVSCIHYHVNALLGKLPLEELLKHLPSKPEPGALSFGVRTRVWEALGGMPYWLRACEDKTFGRLLSANNAQYKLLPDAQQFHHMRNSFAALYAQLHIYSKGNGQTGMVNAHFKKLLGLISVLALVPVVVAVPAALLINSVLLGVYVYRSGYKKLLAVDGKLKKASYLYLVPEVLLARDLGTITGHIKGLYDWFSNPLFKKQYKRYFRLNAI